MAAPTETYVDPSIAGNSGAGTIGDPYGDLQHALDTMTRDATNGDRINIKAGTDEILTGTISLATYGTPTLSATLTFQGYTSAAGDGGQGGIDGNATYNIHTAAGDGIQWKDLRLHNCGSAAVVGLARFGILENCEIDNTTGDGVQIFGIGWASCVGCHIHNIGGYGINHEDGAQAFIFANYLVNGANDFSVAIRTDFSTGSIAHNIISIDGASIGIETDGSGPYGIRIFNNSVLSDGGTGVGIQIDRVLAQGCFNNLVEGFSGAGGGGIVVAAGATVEDAHIMAHNAVYNCTTNYSYSHSHFVLVNDNESVSVSPFAKSGADTFANRFAHFAPVDTGNVYGGAYPSGSNHDKGAVQHAAGPGGPLNSNQGAVIIVENA